MLEGEIKIGQSETWQHWIHKTKTKTNKKNQRHNTICVGDHYTQTNTNNVNKTCALLQTTEGKDEPNMLAKTKIN